MAHHAATAPPETAIEQESHIGTYMRVFAALLVFTILEYFYAKVFADQFTVLVLGLLAMAGTKAGLVGMYFMHLKFEGRWVYLMLVPAAFLAVVLVCGLYPDMAIHYPTDDTSAVAPGAGSATSSNPDRPAGR